MDNYMFRDIQRIFDLGGLVVLIVFLLVAIYLLYRYYRKEIESKNRETDELFRMIGKQNDKLEALTERSITTQHEITSVLSDTKKYLKEDRRDAKQFMNRIITKLDDMNDRLHKIDNKTEIIRQQVNHNDDFRGKPS